MLVVLHSLPSTNLTCQSKLSFPMPSFLSTNGLMELSKSLVRYDFGFHYLNQQNNLRVLRQFTNAFILCV